jgi:hypothetical protein
LKSKTIFDCLIVEAISPLLELLQKISTPFTPPPLAIIPPHTWLGTFQFSKAALPIDCSVTISLLIPPQPTTLPPRFQLMLLPLSDQTKEQLDLSVNSVDAARSGVAFTAVHLHPLPPQELIVDGGSTFTPHSPYFFTSPKSCPSSPHPHQSLSPISLYETDALTHSGGVMRRAVDPEEEEEDSRYLCLPPSYHPSSASASSHQYQYHSNTSITGAYDQEDSDETFEDMPENWFGPEEEIDDDS